MQMPHVQQTLQFNNLLICYYYWVWHRYCKLISRSNWLFCLMVMSRITQRTSHTWAVWRTMLFLREQTCAILQAMFNYKLLWGKNNQSTLKPWLKCINELHPDKYVFPSQIRQAVRKLFLIYKRFNFHYEPCMIPSFLWNNQVFACS